MMYQDARGMETGATTRWLGDNVREQKLNQIPPTSANIPSHQPIYYRMVQDPTTMPNT